MATPQRQRLCEILAVLIFVRSYKRSAFVESELTMVTSWAAMMAGRKPSFPREAFLPARNMIRSPLPQEGEGQGSSHHQSDKPLRRFRLPASRRHIPCRSDGYATSFNPVRIRRPSTAFRSAATFFHFAAICWGVMLPSVVARTRWGLHSIKKSNLCSAATRSASPRFVRGLFFSPRARFSFMAVARTYARIPCLSQRNC